MENMYLNELKESLPVDVNVVSTSHIEMTILATDLWEALFRDIVPVSDVRKNSNGTRMFDVVYDECGKTLKEMREAVDVVNGEIAMKANCIIQGQNEADELFSLKKSLGHHFDPAVASN